MNFVSTLCHLLGGEEAQILFCTVFFSARFVGIECTCSAVSLFTFREMLFSTPKISKRKRVVAYFSWPRTCNLGKSTQKIGYNVRQVSVFLQEYAAARTVEHRKFVSVFCISLHGFTAVRRGKGRWIYCLRQWSKGWRKNSRLRFGKPQLQQHVVDHAIVFLMVQSVCFAVWQHLMDFYNRDCRPGHLTYRRTGVL